MDSRNGKHFKTERPDDRRLQHMHGTEFITPFIVEDGGDLGVLGRRFYPSFSISHITLHANQPYAVGLTVTGLSKCVVLADAFDGQGMNFNTSMSRHNIYGGRQLLLNICSPKDGVVYDLAEDAGIKMRMVGLTHEQIYRLTERYPDRLEDFWRMLDGFNDDRAVDSQRTPLQQNCLNAIFAQPMLGNMTEEFVNGQIADYLSSLGPRPIPRNMLKVHDTAMLRSKMHDVMQIIENTPPTAFTLRQLAIAVGTNETYLKAAFYHEFGISVFGYIFERRMQIACQLLRDTDLSIDSIANAVGYTESRNFYPAFRHRFAMTPLAYRMAVRK